MTKVTSEEQRLFAERMRAFRKRYSLSQKELALALGMRKATIVYLENCYERPWPETVLQFRRLEEKYERAEQLEMDSLEGMS